MVLLLRVAAANLALGGLLALGPPPLSQWLEWGAVERVWQLSGWIAAGIAVYFGTLWLTGLRWRHMVAEKG
jgi:hypothetical protein